MAEVVFLPATRVELGEAVGGGVFAFDAVVEVSGDDEVKITRHPVEFGVVTTDHFQIQPSTLNLQVLISKTPIGVVEPEPDRVRLAFARLLEILKSGAPTRIVTPERVWQDMVLTKVTRSKTSSTGKVLAATLSFSEVRFARAEFVVVPSSILAKRKASGASKKDKGIQATPEATAGAGAGDATSTTAAQEALREGGQGEAPATDLYGVFGP